MVSVSASRCPARRERETEIITVILKGKCLARSIPWGQWHVHAMDAEVLSERSANPLWRHALYYLILPFYFVFVLFRERPRKGETAEQWGARIQSKLEEPNHE